MKNLIIFIKKIVFFWYLTRILILKEYYKSFQI